MKDETKLKPDQPANNSEAHSSKKPAASAGTASTNGAATIQNLRRSVLTERVRIHQRLVMDSLDKIMDQPNLSDRVQKQLLIAWLMMEHTSLPYHDSPGDPTFSETLLDGILDRLGKAVGHSPGGAAKKLGTSTGGDDDDDDETAVVPQPLGPASPEPTPPLESPKREDPRPLKSPKPIKKSDVDQEMSI